MSDIDDTVASATATASAIATAPTPARTCGACTECCRVIAIATPELTKPADVICNECVASIGCAIFADARRPPVCSSFECGWLANPDAFDDNQRPDISGVIISNPQSPVPMHIADCQVLVAHECWPDATAPDTAGYALVRSLANSGAIVFGAPRGERGPLVVAPSTALANLALDVAFKISQSLEADELEADSLESGSPESSTT
jgi:hypothetical protein